MSGVSLLPTYRSSIKSLTSFYGWDIHQSRVVITVSAPHNPINLKVYIYYYYGLGSLRMLRKNVVVVVCAQHTPLVSYSLQSRSCESV